MANLGSQLADVEGNWESIPLGHAVHAQICYSRKNDTIIAISKSADIMTQIAISATRFKTQS